MGAHGEEPGPQARTSPQTWDKRYESSSAHALYLHIPFCRKKCRYCDFTSSATCEGDPLMWRYVEELQRQIARMGELGLLADCETVYVGGGTPSLLGSSLGELCATASRWCALRELTCEANPESLTPEVVEAMRRGGVTRVSIGVQSLNDRELTALGRIHDADRARESVRQALDAGFDVSVDLMCGIPYQTEASWCATLREVLSLGVGHVSVYPLQLEEGTTLERMVDVGLLDVADDDEAARLMEMAAETLGEAGLARYEVASYARPGASCRHNRAYWTGRPYLGLGTAAAGMITRQGYERLREVMPQLPDLPDEVVRVRLQTRSTAEELVACGEGGTSMAGVRLDLELLDRRQAIAEDLMLGARMAEGVSPALLGCAREAIGAREVDAACDEACREGLAKLTPHGALVPTQSGWLRGNELYGILWSLAGVEEVQVLSC